MNIPSTLVRRRARIEIIPLIDIMFFLLATFIMVSLSMIQNQSVPVNLPSAHSAKADSSKASTAITVTQDGKIYWNKAETTLEALPDQLNQLAASDSDARVLIHGDKKADFGTVVSILDAVRRAGIKHTAIRTTTGKQG
ncbi:MAG TPA: biopolymer transporter ExbD [bacterium]|jgi:biopolymer transport protein ExbD|nr:biopolymer transporter ExbD [bacterium]